MEYAVESYLIEIDFWKYLTDEEPILGADNEAEVTAWHGIDKKVGAKIFLIMSDTELQNAKSITSLKNCETNWKENINLEVQLTE